MAGREVSLVGAAVGIANANLVRCIAQPAQVAVTKHLSLSSLGMTEPYIAAIVTNPAIAVAQTTDGHAGRPYGGNFSKSWRFV